MIICYGDSNTWGYNPLIPPTRYKIKDIYTSLLKEMLSNNTSAPIKILNKGFPARCATSQISEPYKDGYTPFQTEFTDYDKDVELFVIMLGTNDVKLNRQASTIALDIKGLIDIIIDNDRIKNILIICPASVKRLDYENLPPTQILFDFFHNNDNHVQESKNLASELESICKNFHNDKLTFLNGNDFWQSSQEDGIHITPNAHKIIAEKIYDLCMNKELFPM